MRMEGRGRWVRREHRLSGNVETEVEGRGRWEQVGKESTEGVAMWRLRKGRRLRWRREH